MILHMLKRSDWESAKSKGIYHPPSLTEEGFIHCSQPEMIVTVANGLYLGQTDMIILVIDSEMLIAPLIYEDCYETGYAFPHIYGSITPDVVLDVIDFPCKENGEFALPEKLA
ncbi:MAG: DUF952 domain-containing protein [Chloroflexota bacterium]